MVLSNLEHHGFNSPKVPDGSDPLADTWVEEAFKLNDNQMLKEDPVLKAELIKMLSFHAAAFEGGLTKSEVIGQGQAGTTDCVLARVE